MKEDSYDELRKWDREELIDYIDTLKERNKNQEAYIDGLEDHVSALKHTIEKLKDDIEVVGAATPHEEIWDELYCHIHNALQLEENIDICSILAQLLFLMETMEEVGGIAPIGWREAQENEERS